MKGVIRVVGWGSVLFLAETSFGGVDGRTKGIASCFVIPGELGPGPRQRLSTGGARRRIVASAVPETSEGSVVSGGDDGDIEARNKKKKHFDFLKEIERNKKQARKNRERNKAKRDEYLAEMRKAFKLLQIKEQKESGWKWVKRPKRKNVMSLTELRPGDMHEGMVITVNEHGCYVDFGAEKDGYVRLRDMSDTEFLLDAREVVQQGQNVTMYIKYVSPAEKIVTGSFVPVEVESEEEMAMRTPLSDVRVDDELWGEVTKVSNYGAFVDVGVEVPGFLHTMYYPKKPLGALTQDVFWPGQRLRVWAMEVDLDKKRLKLTAERPRTLPRVDYAWFLNEGELIEGTEPKGVRDYYYSAEEGMGLRRGPRASVKRKLEAEQQKEAIEE